MCIAILLALVPAVAPRETIAVWQQNVQIGQLSRILSSPQQHFACDRNIATRRAHIFVKQASPLAIAEKVAVTLGLNLVRTNSG